jgi:hypothetical protein
MNNQGLHLLNNAFVVLIPKKPNPQKVSDFGPISLIHSFAKTISKLLANRLSPELEHLISANQTTFIKKMAIHDNFVYVQQVIKDLHKNKTPSLFIKLDIAKAFDIVNWPYLLHIMSHLGFGQRWHNWVSSLWLTASSSYLLNGEPGKNIMHCRGVRQGDPLSPMLFLLAMEPLHRLCQKAQQMGILSRVSKSCEVFRVFLYADNVAVFIKPTEQDHSSIKAILQIYSQTSGLHVNMDKTHFSPSDVNTLTLLSSVKITILSPPFHAHT